MFFPFYKFKCPGCGNHLEFHCRLSSSMVKCPSCGRDVKLPEPAGAAGKNAWGNWCKGLFLGTSVLILALVAYLLIRFFRM